VPGSFVSFYHSIIAKAKESFNKAKNKGETHTPGTCLLVAREKVTLKIVEDNKILQKAISIVLAAVRFLMACFSSSRSSISADIYNIHS
jgi:hypothetical protein